MQYDVRQCDADEVIPLFNKIVVGNAPDDVKWDDGHVFVKYSVNDVRLDFWIRPSGYATFEFYPDVHNIRFDGEIHDKECIDVLKEHIKTGRGMKVSNFIGLS